MCLLDTDGVGSPRALRGYGEPPRLLSAIPRSGIKREARSLVWLLRFSSRSRPRCSRPRCSRPRSCLIASPLSLSLQHFFSFCLFSFLKKKRKGCFVRKRHNHTLFIVKVYSLFRKTTQARPLLPSYHKRDSKTLRLSLFLAQVT